MDCGEESIAFRSSGVMRIYVVIRPILNDDIQSWCR